jgi:hypothetical protein
MSLSTEATLLSTYVASSEKPVFTDQELEAIVDRNMRATTYIVHTAYTYGQTIIPTIRNGHAYKCIQAGTGDTTEPTWPLTNFAQITDGAVIWQEIGSDWDSLFDLRSAIHEGWRIKAARVAHKMDVKSGDDQVTRDQLIKHCQDMMAMYTPVVTV